MSIFNHNIYDNVRTRVIVLHHGCLLLNPPHHEVEPQWSMRQGEIPTWRLPGGGIRPDESLTDCAVREVFEETGIPIRVLSIAFLREWVVPKYCVVPESEQAGFGIEVYMYACPIDETAAPRPERAGLPTPCWKPLQEISNLPLWPKEIKALAAALIAGRTPVGVPSFVSTLESPWEVPSEAIGFNVPVPIA